MNDQPRTLGGRYQLGKVIGRGGMAQVRQATDTRLGREVAVKELRLDLASDPTFQARFRREAQAAAGLNHPNIVSVYDTGEELEPATGIHVPYIVMELVHGRTLRDILRDGRPILPERALEFSQGVLDALSYSHKAGIVHRDIKPDNVMLTTSGLVKVMDFGIARAVSDTSSTMTQTAAVIGTAQYLSPEQARGETVDARSDIYSAGCLLYELLVGRPPFQGDSPVSVAYQHVRELPVPPSQLDAVVTPPMDAVVLKALEKDPADRYQTASAMRDDIARLLAGHQVTATVPVVTAVPTQTVASAAVAAPTATMALPATERTLGGPAVGPARAMEPAPRRSRSVWGLLIGLLLVALAAVGVLLMQPNQPLQRQIDVPAVLGQSQVIAEKAISDAGLRPVVNPVKGNNDATVNTVTDVDPVAGTKVDPDSVVTITVNVGPDRVTIPNGLVVGKSVEAAKEVLASLGITNVRTQAATSEPAGAKANTVLSVNPIEGTAVTSDTLVVLTYATGEATVPDVRGLPEAEAKAALNRAGFANVTSRPQESTATAGTVINTTPVVNTSASKGDQITLYVATPPATPTASETPSATTRPSTSDPTPSESPTTP